MIKALLVAMLVACTMAQGMGDGVSKSTWGSSDPTVCAAFIEKYIPAKAAKDDCSGGKCECATQGRFQLENGSSFGGFGLHTINCTHHPYGEHSLADVEGMIHNEWGDFSEFHPFMDYNVQLYALSLDEWLEKFEADNVGHTALTWESDDEKSYYSLIINPCGYVVFELIAPHVSDSSKFKKTEEIRFSFASNNNVPKVMEKTHLRAIGVSRATSRLSEVEEFYDTRLKITQIKKHQYSDGTTHLVYMWNTPTKGIQINFINRNSSENAEFTPKMFEDYMRKVHQEVMISDVCGFDQWIDNHYAYDGMGGGGGGPPTFLDVYANHAKKMGLQYHWWSQPMDMIEEVPEGKHWTHHHRQLQPGGGVTQLYVVDPTGFGVQFDGPARFPPSNLPSYTAACKSTDGCAGQGNCKSTDIFFLK